MNKTYNYNLLKMAVSKHWSEGFYSNLSDHEYEDKSGLSSEEISYVNKLLQENNSYIKKEIEILVNKIAKILLLSENNTSFQKNIGLIYNQDLIDRQIRFLNKIIKLLNKDKLDQTIIEKINKYSKKGKFKDIEIITADEIIKKDLLFRLQFDSDNHDYIGKLYKQYFENYIGFINNGEILNEENEENVENVQIDKNSLVVEEILIDPENDLNNYLKKQIKEKTKKQEQEKSFWEKIGGIF